jgi:asparagine synthase (glutamine-hydrolysing)
MTILGFAGRWPEGVDPRRQSDYARTHAAPGGASAQSAQDAFASVHAPQVFQAQGVVVALQGRPFGASGDGADRSDAAAKIHAAYLGEGRNFLRRLEGPFALAIIDETANRTLLAIDRMGVERMTWAVAGGALAFGSSAEQVARFPAVNASIRTQALYDFLMLHMVPAPHTIYEGVYKLRPATAIAFENGRHEVFAYWTPTFEERRETPFEALRAQLHDALDAAVRDRRPDASTGAFLSGGLDSSTVAGKLAGATTAPARTFSIGFGVDAYDELKYADIATRRFGFDAFQYHVTPEDIITAFPLIAGAYDEPFGNSSAVPTYFCALRARERGITRLMAGDGGDEIFGGNERYSRHQVFDMYFKAPAAIRRGVLEPLAGILPGEGGFKPLAKLRSYIEQARIPLPERLESWNFIYREGGSMLEPEFAASIDPRAPFGVMREVYSAAPCKSTLNKMMYYDWYYTLADSDLRKVNTMCALAGVEVTYPMLDTRVVELANRVTPAQKMRRLELRSFYKEAMRGFLPDEILNKTKHGFGLPFGVWLQSHARLRDMIYTHLTDLKARRIVRADFLDRLITAQRAADASYYGYAIWDLAMLEAWLKAHAPGARNDPGPRR